MRGFQKFHRSRLREIISSFLVSSILLLWGCTSAGESERPGVVRETFQEFLAEHEKSFRPSAYDVDVNFVRTEEERQFNALHAATVYTTALPETIPGFRVQVVLTQEIDEANTALNNLDRQMPEQYTYMVYNAPYYK